jgi:hypothetical protein
MSYSTLFNEGGGGVATLIRHPDVPYLLCVPKAGTGTCCCWPAAAASPGAASSQGMRRPAAAAVLLLLLLPQASLPLPSLSQAVTGTAAAAAAGGGGSDCVRRRGEVGLLLRAAVGGV